MGLYPVHLHRLPEGTHTHTLEIQRWLCTHTYLRMLPQSASLRGRGCSWGECTWTWQNRGCRSHTVTHGHALYAPAWEERGNMLWDIVVGSNNFIWYLWGKVRSLWKESKDCKTVSRKELSECKLTLYRIWSPEQDEGDRGSYQSPPLWWPPYHPQNRGGQDKRWRQHV